ncbi:MAG: ankyrin repeat domain-containing protein [Rickettsiales bacterium]
MAAEKGHTEIVKALIKAGADIKAVDNENKTPLQLAKENNHTDVVSALEEEEAARAAEAAETERAANILGQLAKRPYTTIVSQKENPEKKGRGR